MAIQACKQFLSISRSFVRPGSSFGRTRSQYGWTKIIFTVRNSKLESAIHFTHFNIKTSISLQLLKDINFIKYTALLTVAFFSGHHADKNGLIIVCVFLFAFKESLFRFF